MAKKKKGKWLKHLGIFGAIGIAGLIFFATNPDEEELHQLRLKKNLEQRTSIARAIGTSVRSKQFPTVIQASVNGLKPENLEATYTLQGHLQAYAEQLLNQYKPDYGALFMMDATTGATLAMASFEKGAPGAPNLTLRGTFPAASVFKIVTATAAVDAAGIEPHHTIYFNGGNYTLYKKNVMSDKVTKWTRAITLKDAFARSINTAFGRLSLEKLSPHIIDEYAHRFMFNQNIPSDFSVDMGTATVPDEKSFELTEVASGYNKFNLISPVQGAMIAASIVNDGKMVIPYIVENLKNQKGEVVYQAAPLDNGQIMTPDSAEKVRELMEQTILAGTSRKTFRSLVKDRRFRTIEMGGKTGHMTGTNPKGKVDWFVGYATDDEQKIAIAALTVNKEYWTVKSSHLGQTMFRKYFEPVIQQRKISSSK